METPGTPIKRGLSFDDSGTPVRGLSFDDFGTPIRTPIKTPIRTSITPQMPQFSSSASASAHPQTPDRDPLAPVFGSPPKKLKTTPKISTGFYPPSSDLADKNIVLVFHGSYNPVHKGHIQLCKEAMSICASMGLNVTRKIFSVASNETITLKINKKVSTNPGEKREVLFDCDTRKVMISNALKEEQIDGVEIICHKEDNDRYTLVSNAIHRGANDIIVMVGGSDWVDDKPDIIKKGICSNGDKYCFPVLIVVRDEDNGLSSTKLQKCFDNETKFCDISYRSVFDLVKSGEGRVVGGGRLNDNKIMYIRLKNSC